MKRLILQRSLGTLVGLSALALATALLIRSAGAQEVGSSSTPKSASKEAMKAVPQLKEKQVMVATGKEDWSALIGFGANAGMVEMMTEMMVGGSGMEHMKMAPMKPGMKSDKQTAGMPKTSKDESGGWQVIVNTQPDMLKIGKNMLDVTVLDPTGKPVTGAKITSSVAMTSMDMGTAHPKTLEGKDGHYATEAEFSMKGPWRITVTVTPPHQKSFTRNFDFAIAK